MAHPTDTSFLIPASMSAMISSLASPRRMYAHALMNSAPSSRTTSVWKIRATCLSLLHLWSTIPVLPINSLASPGSAALSKRSKSRST